MSAYWVSILTEACIFSIMALGVNLVWGMAGDLDLAFYGYVAVSVYLTLVLTIGKPVPPVTYILGNHLPYPLAVGIAIAVSCVLAAVVGAVALRNLRAIYFAITTLAAISVLYVVVQVYTPLFNGFNGVAGLFHPMASALNLSYTGYGYFFLGLCAVVLLIAAAVQSLLSASPFGRLLRSIRDDEDAAAAFGRRIYATKLKTYVFAAVFAGVGGGLFAAYLGAFNPSAWTPLEILTLYAGVLVGGRGNVLGVIVGTFVVYVVFTELTRYLPQGGNAAFGSALREVLIGALIIGFLKFRPQGLIPEPLGYDGRSWWSPRARWRARRTPSDTASDTGPAAAAEDPAPPAGDASPASSQSEAP